MSDLTYTASAPRRDYRGLRFLLAMKRDPLKFFVRLMNKEGAYASMRVNKRRLVMLNDAAGIQHVLQDGSDFYIKGYFQQMMWPLFGQSMLLREGDVWRERRNHAAPVFAHKNFETITGQMVGAAETMFERWDEKIQRGEAIDIPTEMTHYTLDAMLRSLFHDAHADSADDMRDSLGVILREAEKRFWSAAQLPEWLAYRLPRYRRARKFLKQVVEEMVEIRQKNGAYPEDLLSRLIGYFKPGEQKNLLDEVLAYVIAGHETAAHGLSWALYNLAMHAPVRRAVEAEVAAVLDGEAPEMDQIKNLTYTRRVLEEVFRLFPPVWSISREAITDDQIPLDDGTHLTVRAGDCIMLCHYAVHRREKYWPNPDAFDPDRFTVDAVKARPKFAWFPFGGGPRICIGARFAQIESLIALSMILQRYEFSLVPGQTIAPEPIITLRPKGPILFKMRRRSERTHARVAPETIPEGSRQSKCPFH